MRKTLGVCLLVLLLTGTTSAGIMPFGSPTPPPSQPSNAVQEPTAAAQDPATGGEMPFGGADSLTRTALDLLALLPSLL